MAKAKSQAINYQAQLSEELLTQGQELVDKINQHHRNLFNLIAETKKFSQQVINLEEGEKTLDSFRKKAPLQVPANTLNSIFNLANNTQDFDPEEFDKLANRSIEWKSPLSTIVKMTSIEDREKVKEFLNGQKAPKGDDLNALLPPKPIRSIAPNKELTQEHYDLTYDKLKITDQQFRGILKRDTEKLAEERKEEASTNHLIEYLAKLTTTPISTTENSLKIDKLKVLKLLTAPGKIAYQYKLDAIKLEAENKKIKEEQERLALNNRETTLKLNQLQEQMNSILQQMPQLQSSGLHLAPAA